MAAMGSGLAGDARGIAAVEFALLLPLIAVMFFGTYEVTQILRLNLKLSHAAGAVTQIIAKQSSSVTPGPGGTLGNICSGAAMVMSPFPGGPLAAAIVSVTNRGGNPTVDWESDNSCASAASPLGSVGAIALATTPNNLIPNAGDSIVVVKADYAYSGISSVVLPKTITFSQLSFTRPNNNTTIACTGC